VSDGGWRLFWAEHDRVRGPVTRWPSESELTSTFQEMRKLSPEEGLRQAEGLAGYR
jgi:hypothetical protein